MLILQNNQLFEAKLKSCEKDKEKVNNTGNAEKNKKTFIEKNDLNNNDKTEDLILKNINERNILITLPQLPLDVTRHFLMIWLGIKNVCYLDSAFCNKKQRTIFLDILNGFVISHVKFSGTDLFLKWISKKNVFIEKFLFIN
jgi:hypothetical protein